eukprot:g498.t1
MLVAYACGVLALVLLFTRQHCEWKLVEHTHVPWLFERDRVNSVKGYVALPDILQYHVLRREFLAPWLFLKAKFQTSRKPLDPECFPLHKYLREHAADLLVDLIELTSVWVLAYGAAIHILGHFLVGFMENPTAEAGRVVQILCYLGVALQVAAFLALWWYAGYYLPKKVKMLLPAQLPFGCAEGSSVSAGENNGRLHVETYWLEEDILAAGAGVDNMGAARSKSVDAILYDEQALPSSGTTSAEKAQEMLNQPLQSRRRPRFYTRPLRRTAGCLPSCCPPFSLAVSRFFCGERYPTRHEGQFCCGRSGPSSFVGTPLKHCFYVQVVLCACVLVCRQPIVAALSPGGANDMVLTERLGFAFLGAGSAVLQLLSYALLWPRILSQWAVVTGAGDLKNELHVRNVARDEEERLNGLYGELGRALLTATTLHSLTRARLSADDVERLQTLARLRKKGGITQNDTASTLEAFTKVLPPELLEQMWRAYAFAYCLEAGRPAAVVRTGGSRNANGGQRLEEPPATKKGQHPFRLSSSTPSGGALSPDPKDALLSDENDPESLTASGRLPGVKAHAGPAAAAPVPDDQHNYPAGQRVVFDQITAERQRAALQAFFSAFSWGNRAGEMNELFQTQATIAMRYAAAVSAVVLGGHHERGGASISLFLNWNSFLFVYCLSARDVGLLRNLHQVGTGLGQQQRYNGSRDEPLPRALFQRSRRTLVRDFLDQVFMGSTTAEASDFVERLKPILDHVGVNLRESDRIFRLVERAAHPQGKKAASRSYLLYTPDFIDLNNFCEWLDRVLDGESPLHIRLGHMKLAHGVRAEAASLYPPSVKNNLINEEKEQHGTKQNRNCSANKATVMLSSPVLPSMDRRHQEVRRSPVLQARLARTNENLKVLKVTSGSEAGFGSTTAATSQSDSEAP